MAREIAVKPRQRLQCSLFTSRKNKVVRRAPLHCKGDGSALAPPKAIALVLLCCGLGSARASMVWYGMA